PEVVHQKRMELLKRAVPKLSRLAVLWDSSLSLESRGLGGLSWVLPAANTLGIRVQLVEVKDPEHFERGFASARTEKADAVLLEESPRAVAKRALIAALALKSRLPIMGQFRSSRRAA